VLAQLGDSEALDVLAQLDRQTPAVFQRYQVTLRTDLALAHAHFGQVEEAALHLGEAAARNRAIESVEKARRMFEVRRALTPYQTSPAVAAVDEVLREVAAGLTSSRAGSLARRPPDGRRSAPTALLGWPPSPR
jgi:hypothetical protein